MGLRRKKWEYTHHLCRFGGSHSGGYEEYYLLGYDCVVRYKNISEEHVAPIFRVQE
jgi:hypothetical protein